MKPLIVSTGDALSCTQAMSYASRSALSPVSIELDERGERLGHRLGRKRDRRLEVLDDGGNLRAVAAADAIHLFDDRAVLLHETGVERVRLVKRLEILHRHADVEVVRARRQDVLAGRRRLVRHHRIDVRIEEHRAQPRQQLVERFAVLAAETSRRPSAAACAAAANASGVHVSTNFLAVRLLYGPLLIQNSLV